MVFQINGKTLLECNEDDIKLLIDDPAFRESEYIDYKENFSFLEIEDKKVKNIKKVEFRNDVCSFANAEGGYLVFGVKEEQGTVSGIIGITILKNDTDKFELERRNDLQPIFPRVPNIKFSFIPLQSGKYVVVMYIKHDSFAPYTQIENQVNYKFFKRAGNEKVTMTYAEIRNMFNQSLSLDKEILSFRKERINYYSSLQGRTKDYPNGYIPRDYIWDMIQGTCDGYYKHKEILCNSERLFLCLDIIGCKGVVSQTPSEDGFIYYTGTIDRNTLTCDPVVITDTSDETMFIDMIKKLHLNFMLSIGVKFGKDLDSLIKELYPQ